MSEESDRYDRAAEIFLRAVKLDPAERESFLRTACSNDTHLREDVEGLLANDPGERRSSLIPGLRGGAGATPASGARRSADSEWIGRTVGRYRIVAKLGEGGMGVVWQAEDPLVGRSVAIKLLPEVYADSAEARERFLREARSAGRLEHPGIAAVYDAGEVDGRLYIAIRRVEGQTILSLLSAGPLSLPDAVSLARQSADALGHAHENGILHRDVSSKNLMATSDGKAVLIDFGLALPEGGARVTQDGATMGTPGYLAPEVLNGHEPDQRSDLYSLGVVLYEMVTGRLPFSGERLAAVIHASITNPPEPPRRYRPDLPDDLEQVILRCLEKEPEKRFQTAQELEAALSSIEEQMPVDDESVTTAFPQAGRRSVTPSQRRTPEPGSKRFASTARRRTWVLATAFASVLAVAAVVWISTQRQARRPGDYTSVAVLPLQNVSEDPDESKHIAAGLGEALVTRLTKLSKLRVIPWMTSQRYIDTKLSIKEIARELNVDAVIVGTFRMRGDRLQGTVALVDTESGFQQWADEFDERFVDFFDLLDSVIKGVARNLIGQLTGEEEKELSLPPAQSVAAYELYLRGASELQESTEESAEVALAYFQRAVEVDPELAEAYAGIGAVYTLRHFRGWSSGVQDLDEAGASYLSALRLKPSLGVAHRGLMRVYWQRGDRESVLRQGKLVNDAGLSGVEAMLVRADAYLLGQLPDKALPIAEQIIDFDPANASAHWVRAIASTFAGRYDDAVVFDKQFIQRFGEDAEILRWLAVSYDCLGDYEKAGPAYEEAIRAYGKDAHALHFASNFHRKLGESGKARQLALRGVVESLERLDAQPDNNIVRSGLVGFYALLGDTLEMRREYETLLAGGGSEARDWGALWCRTGDDRFIKIVLDEVREGRSDLAPTPLRLLEDLDLTAHRESPTYAALVAEVTQRDRRLRELY